MISVAIDGPSGAGKSTLARAAAQVLGFVYVDTGACYRAAAFYVLEQGVSLEQLLDYSPEQEHALQELLAQVTISLEFQEGEQHVFLGERNISADIRTSEVTKAASAVAAFPAVRQWLLEYQRSLARNRNVIMDGRDIGTVVLPDATVKVFLTASPQVRATRRHRELVAKGEEISYNKLLADIQARDNADSTRRVAPLRQAEDATLLDTSTLSFEESLEQLVEIIKGSGAFVL